MRCCRFAVSDFMGFGWSVGRSVQIVVMWSFFLSLPLPLFPVLFGVAADTFVADRVCVCFYLVNFPTFILILATLSAGVCARTLVPFSRFYLFTRATGERPRDVCLCECHEFLVGIFISLSLFSVQRFSLCK